MSPVRLKCVYNGVFKLILTSFIQFIVIISQYSSIRYMNREISQRVLHCNTLTDIQHN